jgi:cytochrome c-type biogenesis protein CcmH
MMLWFVLALMTAAAMAAVLWPILRARSLRSGSDVAVYRDQLDEIRRDRAAGLIGETEADAAQVEVSRRLLAAADAEAATLAQQPVSTDDRRLLGAFAAVAMAVVAGGLYLVLGSPTLPDMPLAARNPTQTIGDMIAQVEQALARNPDDGRGWEAIAPVYLRLGRFDDAVKARRLALALNGETSERQSGLGEALTAAEDGTVTPEAKTAFERAVALDEGNFKARYYLGIAAEQAGRRSEAAAMWRAILARAPPDAPWLEFIRQELTRVEGPSAQDVAAASEMGTDQRMAMIRGMVERLADKLKSDGSDLEGWLRLVRSYMVLGERDKAKAAAGEARRALANDPDKVRQINELAKGLGLEG